MRQPSQIDPPDVRIKPRPDTVANEIHHCEQREEHRCSSNDLVAMRRYTFGWGDTPFQKVRRHAPNSTTSPHLVKPWRSAELEITPPTSLCISPFTDVNLSSSSNVSESRRTKYRGTMNRLNSYLYIAALALLLQGCIAFPPLIQVEHKDS